MKITLLKWMLFVLGCQLYASLVVPAVRQAYDLVRDVYDMSWETYSTPYQLLVRYEENVLPEKQDVLKPMELHTPTRASLVSMMGPFPCLESMQTIQYVEISSL